MSEQEREILEAGIKLLFTFNNPQNPLLIHKGMGVIPKQADWLAARIYDDKEDRLSIMPEVVERLIEATEEEGYAYTLENLEVMEDN